MNNKHRKLSKCALSILTACTLIFSVFAPVGTAVFAAPASPGIEVSYIPYEEANAPEGLHPDVKGLLTVSGNIGKTETTPVILMVLTQGATEDNLNNDIASFKSVVHSYRQVTTAANGTFNVSFGIGFAEDDDVTTSTKGNYTVVASFAGAEEVLADEFYYSTSAHVGEALDAVNRTTTSSALKTEITVTSPKELALDTKVYDLLVGKEYTGIDDDIMTYVFENKEALKADNGVGFPSGAELRDCFEEACVVYTLKTADDATELKGMLADNEDYLGLDKLDAYVTYSDTLTDSEKTALCGSILGFADCTSLADMISLFEEECVLYAIESAELWSDVKPILVQNKELITDAIGYKPAYYSLTDTSKVDKAIVGKDYDSVADLAKDINKKGEDAADTQKKPVSSGGSGGSGGVAVVPAPSITPPVTTTPAQPSQAPEASNGSFADMAGYEWASEAVEALKDMGAINGKTDSAFAPADYVTREEFIKMFVSLFGEVDSDASADFADVDSSAWYYSYVASALKAGIVNGVGDGRFGVGQNISRQDIAVIAFRALAIAKGENEVSFDDFDSVADYAKDAVDALSSQGIINGMGDGSFAPNANATRAQAAKILYELYKLKEGKV